MLLLSKALNVDETSMQVNQKTTGLMFCPQGLSPLTSYTLNGGKKSSRISGSYSGMGASRFMTAGLLTSLTRTYGFRNRLDAKAYCRISSYLQTMANLGFNPLVAIQIALEGEAASMMK